MCKRRTRQALSTMLVCMSGCALLAARPLSAQQVVADGTTEQASGTIDTGSQPGAGGSALRALNGGVIWSAGPVSLVTGGDGAHAAAALDGGFIDLFDGSTVRTTGTDASGLAASGDGALITASNLNVEATNFGGYGVAAEDGAAISLNGGQIRSVSSALRVGPGGSISAAGVAATATGANAIGVLAQGGFIELRDSSVTSLQGSSDHGLLASDGGRIVADGVTVKASGDGLRLGESTLEFRNGHVEAAGNGARSAGASAMVLEASSISAGLAGLTAVGTQSSIRARQMTISVHSEGGYGLLAASSGRIDSADSTIDVSGDQTVAIGADGDGSVVASSGDVVSTVTPNDGGNGSRGALASGGGQIWLNVDPGSLLPTGGRGRITTAGPGNHGVAAVAKGSIVQVADEVISTTGPAADAVYAEAGGLISLRNVASDTRGALAGGIVASGADSRVTALQTLVSTRGESASAVEVLQGGQVDLVGGSLTTSGTEAHAASIGGASQLRVSDSSLGASGPGANALVASADSSGAGVAIFDHSTLRSSRAAAVRVAGTALRLEVLRGSRITGNGTLAEVGGGTVSPEGSLRLETSASIIDGAVVTTAGTTHLALRNGSTWNINGVSNLTTVLNDASLIAFATPGSGSFGVLAVGGYSSRAGAMHLNAQLNGDGSLGDRLLIFGGGASGTTAVTVTNAGGGGDLTVGDGILLVYALQDGTTQPRSFALAQPVIAGPYEYTLHRGNRAGDLPENWYLRSDYLPPSPPDPTPPDPPAPTPPDPPTPPSPPPDPPTPPSPPPPPQPPPVPPAPPRPPMPPRPNYRPEVSVYAALPALGLHYGRAMLANFHDRSGDQVSRLAGESSGPISNGAWARVLGESGAYDGDGQGVLGQEGPQFDFEMTAVQLGADIYRHEHADGQREEVGAYVAYGRAKADVTHFDGVRSGKDEVKARSIGGYWTHFGTSGWYLDGVLQGSWYRASAISLRHLGLELDREGFGWGASLEAGYPLQRGDWRLEPQLQLIYQDVDDQEGSDVAARVQYRDVRSFSARLGGRLARSWNLPPAADGSQRRLSGWLRLSAWREFENDAVTEFSAARGVVPFRAGPSGDWGALAIGAELQTGQASSLYAHLGYQSGLEGDYSAFDAGVGLRWNW
ncbi:MAG TPA: autotransporter outer membrane beta-barrel domain-containing protein [Stenotrophomonas sp.]